MVCKKCGAEIPDDSVFCGKCGAKINGESFFNEIRNKKSVFVMKKPLIVLIVVLIIVIATTFVYAGNSLRTFKNALKNGDYKEAIKIYDNEIRGNPDKEKQVTSFLKNEIQETLTSYKGGKITYNEAINKLQIIINSGFVTEDAKNALDEVKRINESNIAFENGQKLLANKNYIEGIKELRKVIKDDKNYIKAQELIKNSVDDYKKEVLSKTDDLAKEAEYSSALNIINEALTIIPNDADLAERKSTYEKLNKEKAEAEKKKMIEELKAKQEVVVIDARVTSDWLHSEIAEILVKNISNKVVKKYIVGWMAFDKNNYPVKSGWVFPEYLKEGVAEINIQPGEIVGRGYGFDLGNSGAKKIIACIKEVEYYDGSKWYNEYYDYWVDEHKEKPLNND